MRKELTDTLIRSLVHSQLFLGHNTRLLFAKVIKCFFFLLQRAQHESCKIIFSSHRHVSLPHSVQHGLLVCSLEFCDGVAFISKLSIMFAHQDCVCSMKQHLSKFSRCFFAIKLIITLLGLRCKVLQTFLKRIKLCISESIHAATILEEPAHDLLLPLCLFKRHSLSDVFW